MFVHRPAGWTPATLHSATPALFVEITGHSPAKNTTYV